jgi:hypothetical protein
MMTVYRFARSARTVLVAVFLCQLLLACAAQGLPLNSERIAARYGSYSVRVLQQDAALRVSSLQSGQDDAAVTRTLAITRYAEPNPAYAAAASEILTGASIGRTFQEAGWKIDKTSLLIDTIAVTPREHIIRHLMKINLPQRIAIHAYRFEVSRGSEHYLYATIVELHHPDYLRESDLRDIYGASLRLSAADAEESLAATRAKLLELSIEPAP